jgi:hypothetical protein
MTRVRRLATVAILSSLAPVFACGSGGDTTPGTFAVDFPTVAAGVAVIKSTTGVGVQVFATSPTGTVDGSAGGGCQALITQALNGTVMEKIIAQTPTPVSPCDLLAGKGSLPVAYGTYAFLAVAQSSAQKVLLVGCAEQTISSTNTNVVIPMTLVNETMSVPVTTCTSLEQACPSGGNC